MSSGGVYPTCPVDPGGENKSSGQAQNSASTNHRLHNGDHDKTDSNTTTGNTRKKQDMTSDNRVGNQRPKSPKVLIRKNTPVMLPTIAKINAKTRSGCEGDILEDGEEEAAILQEEEVRKHKERLEATNQITHTSSVRVVVSCEGQSEEFVEIQGNQSEKLKDNKTGSLQGNQTENLPENQT